MSKSKKDTKIPDTLIKVGKQGNVYQQKHYKKAERAYGSTQKVSETYEEVILDRSAAEIIDQINKRVKSPYNSLYWAIAAIILVGILQPVSNVLSTIVLIVFFVITYVVYQQDIKRKTTPLFYEFSDNDSEKKFSHEIELFVNLGKTQRSWRLKSKVSVSDWKRNAGSNSALIRHIAKIGKQAPKLLKTNVEVWGVDAGNIKFYLLPDRFFVFQDGIYSAIPYNEIKVFLEKLEYVEQESLPSDATVIGKTWKYVRRDGGPDRRFKNNRQLPIVKYAVVGFASANFTAYLIVSNSRIASAFTQSFAKVFYPSTTNKSIPKSKIESPSLPVEDSSKYLEPLMKAASEGSELTTNQIAKLLGVSSSFITKNPETFDYEGFRLSRSGRSGRQISWSVEYIDK
ncbi:hypothetical protein VB712_17540 [Spirulina sp. CCNP1310]|uniref:hypothetical protein n=1 Tax=Spirulina sp. CCNP1310 TaxID=3110249 RepID=UPI002B1FD436|nr:hypothetical protein [Spirulina sp. CCNP1310]MEA5421032.1 hypothetical protein [Spirulina sp. CCNP1310]